LVCLFVDAASLIVSFFFALIIADTCGNWSLMVDNVFVNPMSVGRGNEKHADSFTTAMQIQHQTRGFTVNKYCVNAKNVQKRV
jgi:hypothetical protein